MSDLHGLTRHHSDPTRPACLCGFNDPQWESNLQDFGLTRAGVRARKAVLEHADHVTDLPQRPASPSDPFDVGAEQAYPRASVRRKPDGWWLLTLWDGPDVVHELDRDAAHHKTVGSAVMLGWLIIGAHRRNGTRLNGMAAA